MQERRNQAAYSDRKAHHTAMAPEAAGMHIADASPLAVRQKPHFRIQRILPLPLKDAQNRKPEFAPGSNVGSTTISVDLHTNGQFMKSRV